MTRKDALRIYFILVLVHVPYLTSQYKSTLFIQDPQFLYFSSVSIAISQLLRRILQIQTGEFPSCCSS